MRCFLTALITCFGLAAAMAEEPPPVFDLEGLEGDWEGHGSFVMPVTGISMSIDGEADFTYDSVRGYLRTALTGTKFMFKYADSGHLRLDSLTDSVSWEIWDGFGKHVIYDGVAAADTLRGRRYKGSSHYDVEVRLINADSITFRLRKTDADGTVADKALFDLGRKR